LEKALSPKAEGFRKAQAALRAANAEAHKLALAEWAAPITSTAVDFGPPEDRAWLPPKTRIAIEAALDEGLVKIANGTEPHSRVIWEILQRWADALLRIYLSSIGLPKDAQLARLPRNARLDALLDAGAISENVSARVLGLIAEYKLPADECDRERLPDLVSYRTRNWRRRREAKVLGAAVRDLALLVPPVVVPAEATVNTARGRAKNAQRERTKKHVKELCDRYIPNRDICRNLYIAKGLDEKPTLYPSPWGSTWVQAFGQSRNKVDRYINGLVK